MIPFRIVLVALAVVPWAGVQAQEELFLQGNAHYQEGDYGAAVEAYQAVVDAGLESAEIYYNLGNAHFRAGSPQRAVLNYERALRLDPANEDAAANLAFVRQRLADRIEPLPRFWLLRGVDWWIQLIPRALLIGLSAGSYLLAGAAVVSLVLGRPRRWRAFVRRAGAVAGFVALLLGGTLTLRETRIGAPVEAVVMVSEVSALSAPSSEGGLVLFSLHAGTKVRVDQRSGEWAEVVLEDGKVGWLRFDVLELI